jgi:4-hydroxybenzoate polyprenyltransferase
MTATPEEIPSSKMRPSTFVRLLRMKQWAKNLLVFAAPLFSGISGHSQFIVPALLAFAAMSLVSSTTYIINDLLDVERDRQHPVKRLRPLASGAIPKALGIAIAAICFCGGIGIAAWLGKGCLAIVSAYLLLQVLYNWKLKKLPIADVYTIAVGFILRAVLGAAAIGVSISGWLLFCTGALALMLGFAKRRNEFIVQGEDRTVSRESLAHYNRSSLDALVCMFASGAAMCYAIYSLQSKTAHKYPAMILTSVFVFYGIARYVLIVFSADEGGEPADVLFKDKHIIFSVLGFVLAAALATSGIHIPLLEQ